MNGGSYTFDSYVIDALMRDLVGHDHKPSAFLIYLTLSAVGGDGTAAMSYAQLAEHTGLSKRSVQDGVKLLVVRELVKAVREGRTETPRYQALRPWRA